MKVRVRTVVWVAALTVLLSLAANRAFPQATTINGQRTVSSALTVNGETTLAGTTKTINFEASLPGTCTAPSGSTPGECVFRTSDNTLHCCTATNTFTQIGGGGSSTLTSVDWATAIAASCSASNAGQVVPVAGALVGSVECSNASGSYEWLMRHNGRRWQIPTLSQWTQVAASSPTTTTTQLNGAISMLHPNDTESNGDWEWFSKTDPTAPYSFTAWFAHCSVAATGTSHGYSGIGFRQNSITDSTIINYNGTSGTYDFAYTLWTDNKTPSTTYTSSGFSFYGSNQYPSIDSCAQVYFCVTNDEINRTVNYSLDGITYIQHTSHAFNTDMTPDEIMFGNNSDNAGTQFTVFRGFAIRTGSTTCGAF